MNLRHIRGCEMLYFVTSYSKHKNVNKVNTVYDLAPTALSKQETNRRIGVSIHFSVMSVCASLYPSVCARLSVFLSAFLSLSLWFENYGKRTLRRISNLTVSFQIQNRFSVTIRFS